MSVAHEVRHERDALAAAGVLHRVDDAVLWVVVVVVVVVVK